MAAAENSDPDWLLALSLHEEEQDALYGPTSHPLTGWGNPMFDEDRDEPFRLRTILSRLLPFHATRPSTAGCIPADSDVSVERSRLLLRIDHYGLYEKAVKGDGNCQFRAVSDQLYRTEDFFKEVRSVATDRLQCHPEVYSNFVEGDYGEYVRGMQRDSAWGDHVTLKAIADHYGAEVCVLTSFTEDPVLKIVPETSRTLRTLWLSFWAEVHYNSLYPAREPPSQAR